MSEGFRTVDLGTLIVDNDRLGAQMDVACSSLAVGALLAWRLGLVHAVEEAPELEAVLGRRNTALEFRRE